MHRAASIIAVALVVILGWIVEGYAASCEGSKRGLLINGPVDQTVINNFGPMGMYYSYQASTPKTTYGPFTPMLPEPANVNPSEIATAQANGNTLLTFNEPDGGTQFVSPSEAISYWPTFEAMGMRLSSPAVSQYSGNPKVWIDEFMGLVQQQGRRVDFMAVHWYSNNVGSFTPSGAATEFIRQMQELYDTYQRPIWITEFAYWLGEGSNYADQLEFMNLVLPQLDSLPFIEYYFWWTPNSYVDAERPGWSNSLADASFNLNTLGVRYANCSGEPPPPAQGSLYVSTAGNDTTGDGSEGNPWRTLQKASDNASPGDTIYLRGGSYTDRTILSSSGSALGGYITIRNYPNENPTYTGNGSTHFITGPNISYTKIIGLKFDNYNTGGIQFYGDAQYIEIRNNSFTNQTAGGHTIVVGGMDYPRMGAAKHIIIDGNTLFNIRTGVDAAFDEAITMAWDVEYFEITNNVLDTIHYIGINSLGHTRDWTEWYINFLCGFTCANVPVNAQPWPRKGRIAYNTVRNGLNSPVGIPCAGIYFDGGRDITAEYNKIDNWVYYGIAVSSEEENYDTFGVLIRFNTIRDTYVGMACGTFSDGASDTTCVHNSLYNRSDYIGNIQHGFGNEINVKNNISQLTGPASHTIHYLGTSNTPTLDYNLYYVPNAPFTFKGVGYSNFASYQAATGQDAHSRTGNPLFVNPAGNDFQLQEGSDAIDTGGFLTTAVGSGSSSTTLAVGNSRYFSDGRGLTVGDTIQVGAVTSVVASVNHTTNTITLSAAITWSNGANVSYPYVGAAPDIGAFELGSVVPPGLSIGPFYMDVVGGVDNIDCNAARVIGTPRKTWANIQPCAASGFTVYMRAGSYPPFKTSITSIPAGTTGNPSVFEGYQSEVVTIAVPTDQAGIWLDNNDRFLTFKKIVVDGQDNENTIGLLIFSGVSDIVFEMGEIKDAFYEGIRLDAGASRITIRNSVIHGSNSLGQSFDEGVSVKGATDVNILGNTIYGNNTHGVRLSGGCTGAVVRGNVIRNNVVDGVKIDNCPSPLIANNGFYQNDVGVEATSLTSVAYVYHNDFVSQSHEGLKVNSGAQAVNYVNNSFLNNSTAIVDSGTASVSATNLLTPSYTDTPPTGWHKTGVLGTTLGLVTTDFYNMLRQPGVYTIGMTQESLPAEQPMLAASPRAVGMLMYGSGANRSR